jgi:hypothetical protein
MARRTTRYQLKWPGGRIAHRGITDRTLEERWGEHQASFPGTYIVPIGPKVSRESALRWERKGGKRI